MVIQHKTRNIISYTKNTWSTFHYRSFACIKNRHFTCLQLKEQNSCNRLPLCFHFKSALGHFALLVRTNVAVLSIFVYEFRGNVLFILWNKTHEQSTPWDECREYSTSLLTWYLKMAAYLKGTLTYTMKISFLSFVRLLSKWLFFINKRFEQAESAIKKPHSYYCYVIIQERHRIQSAARYPRCQQKRLLTILQPAITVRQNCYQ